MSLRVGFCDEWKRGFNLFNSVSFVRDSVSRKLQCAEIILTFVVDKTNAGIQHVEVLVMLNKCLLCIKATKLSACK